MKKIAITGSLSSGKTTASKILALSKGPLFSADKVVRDLYKDKKFISTISKKFKIKSLFKVKNTLKKKILDKNSNIKKLEKIIHPLVRKEMIKFTKKNTKKKLVFYEIPLLVESKLLKDFDVIFFIKAKKSLRLSRFKKKGGNPNLFYKFDRRQFKDQKKMKFCDHVVVNEKNKNILKKNLKDIFRRYE